MCLHTARAKRKRCYDVMLSGLEGSTIYHLANTHYQTSSAGGKHRLSFFVFGGTDCTNRHRNYPLGRMYYCNKKKVLVFYISHIYHHIYHSRLENETNTYFL